MGQTIAAKKVERLYGLRLVLRQYVHNFEFEQGITAGIGLRTRTGSMKYMQCVNKNILPHRINFTELIIMTFKKWTEGSYKEHTY